MPILLPVVFLILSGISAPCQQRVRLLLVLAQQYINHKPVDVDYLQGALPCAQQALELADSIRSDLPSMPPSCCPSRWSSTWR